MRAMQPEGGVVHRAITRAPHRRSGGHTLLPPNRKWAWFNLGLQEAPPNPPPIGGRLGGPQVTLAAVLGEKNSGPPPNSPRPGVTPPSATQNRAFLNRAPNG